MTFGYSDPARVSRLSKEMTTWELYQVTIDLYHVMFWFEDGRVLANVCYRFETVSIDGATYIYDVQAEGNRKQLFVDDLLRRKVTSVSALDARRLVLVFEGGAKLIIHDCTEMRSAWFYRYNGTDGKRVLWSEDDEEGSLG